MKAIILFLLVSFSTIGFSQTTNNNENEDFKIEELPEIVLKKIGEDFSVYLPDRNPDTDVRQLQDYFIAYELGKDFEGYDNYLVIMNNAKGTLTATYNHKGKLIKVVEKYENVRLPSSVIYSVIKKFPDWGIVDDKYMYTQTDGDVLKKHYKVKIKKGRETKRLLVTPNGEILKG
ncbi:hypothetical protein [Flavobacterium okayamense]|uniref:Beta-lactamase-inhibitor-like, PepSY-like n=1 Tax=Flavobacterium okayamense TaxID=2830782 RepID=A0ABN6HYK6_9FLAO|nr:hypothetical protein [Flavobacterium okayamense]BCY29473.1 hypothetical protein KK2020170_23410 [Flavobacterium okayamense]